MNTFLATVRDSPASGVLLLFGGRSPLDDVCAA